MLKVKDIKMHSAAFEKALKKRNFEAKSYFDQILDLDEKRRLTQTELDEVLAKSNSISKQIGMLFKSGQTEEANTLKAETS